LYELGYTLPDAIHLIDPSALHIRQAMTNRLTDQVAKKDWAFANRLNPKEFENQISSTLNRLGRFIRNDFLRAIFGQVEHSFDLTKALEEGHIILANLSTRNGQISNEESELFGTLLMNDLWTAAQERGKSKDIKSFYVYIDEFQKFVSPTISDNLDQARGYLLSMTRLIRHLSIQEATGVRRKRRLTLLRMIWAKSHLKKS
jgi:hypothetical protein